jgi:WD40 repeat protein
MVRIWDPETGRVTQELAAGTSRVRWLTVSADGRRLAASDRKVVKVWDIASGDEIATVPGTAAGPDGFALSADGGRLVTRVGSGRVSVWDADTGALLRRFVGGRKRGAVAITADGHAVASVGATDGRIRMWDVDSGKKTHAYPAQAGVPRTMMFAGDGRHIVTGDSDGVVRVRSLADGSTIREIGAHEAAVTSLAFNHDETRLATGSDDGTAAVWDYSQGSLIARFGAAKRARSRRPVRAVALRGDGARLAMVGRGIKLWHVDAQREAALPTPLHVVGSVRTNADGTRALTMLRDGRLMLWDTDPGVWLWGMPVIRGGRRTVSRFSEDGRSILVVARSGLVTVLDTDTVDERSFDIGPMDGLHMAYTPDLRYLATTEARETIVLTDTRSGERWRTFSHGGELVMSLALSRDGAFLAASVDAQLLVWDIDGPETPRVMAGRAFRRVRASPWVHIAHLSDDGASLIASSHVGLTLWDAQAGEALETVSLGERFRSDRVRGRTLRAPSGSCVVVLSADGDGYLWSAVTPRKLQPVFVPIGPAVAITADGLLVTEFDPASDDIEVLSFGKDNVPFPHLPASALSADGATMVRSPFDTGLEVWRRAGRGR